MIQPEEILRKAEAIYRDYLRSYIAGDTSGFFPRVVPANRNPGKDLAVAIEKVRRLREGSRDVIGYGYRVVWREINSRRLGRNAFPDRITFDTPDDLVRFVGKTREFAAVCAAIDRLRTEFPVLVPWAIANLRGMVDAAAVLEGLLSVLRCLSERPRPGCFARELPLPVDTKFVERNQAILRPWLDAVMPPHAVRADEDHFERRYGLRYMEPTVMVRFLDAVPRCRLGFPCDVVSLLLRDIETWSLADVQVVIVENKVNLLTLPAMPNTIALGGLGNGVLSFRYLCWMKNCVLTYWGDLDIDGLEILSRVRSIYPQTHSVLMDAIALERWRELSTAGNGQVRQVPPYLTDGEGEAFARCVAGNLRIEQERIPQSEVIQVFGAVGRAGPLATTGLP